MKVERKTTETEVIDIEAETAKVRIGKINGEVSFATVGIMESDGGWIHVQIADLKEIHEVITAALNHMGEEE